MSCGGQLVFPVDSEWDRCDPASADLNRFAFATTIENWNPTLSVPPKTSGSTVKLIIAIVQPSRLEEVKEALTEVEVFRLTVLDCLGFGRQKGQKTAFRGHDVSVNLLRKVQLQIAVNDEFVEPTINAILKGAKTGEKGQIGDGKIFVLPMDDCIRIRTGERGPEAI